MSTDSPDTPETIWELDQQHVSLWRSWDGEVVVYDDLSGDTLKLDVIMAEVFRFLLSSPATRSQLTAHLASAFHLDADTRLQHLATTALNRSRHAGLVKPAVNDAPPVPAD